jgi:hypothetical protein
MTALGYSSNKKNFQSLAEKTDFDFIKKNTFHLRKKEIHIFINKYLEHISGIKADKNIEQQPLKLKWKLLKSRPQSAFFNRIKTGAIFLSNIIFMNDDDISAYFVPFLHSHTQSMHKLSNLFISANKKNSIGKSHLEIILCNSVYITAAAYYRRADSLISGRILNSLIKHKGCLINTKIKFITENIGLNKKIINSLFIYQLGTLYIYDNFCSILCLTNSGTNSDISPLNKAISLTILEDR